MEPEKAQESPRIPKRDLTPKTETRKAFLALLDSGLSIQEAIAKSGAKQSSAFRWAKIHREGQAKQAKREKASALNASTGKISPRERLEAIAVDPDVLPGYQVQALGHLIRADDGAKSERIIPVSVLDWLESLDSQDVEGK